MAKEAQTGKLSQQIDKAVVSNPGNQGMKFCVVAYS
jgi:hypothetical protein